MHIVKKLEKTILFLIKVFLYVTLLFTFFIVYTPNTDQLFYVTKTTFISFPVFALVLIGLVKIYGGFPIGKKQRNDISFSIFLSALITDVITYCFLSIMLSEIMSIPRLILIGMLQTAEIYVILWLAFKIYYRLNPPLKAAIIYGDETNIKAYAHKIGQAKELYSIRCVIPFHNENLFHYIKNCQMIFIADVPSDEKRTVVEYAYKHNIGINIVPDLYDLMLSHSKHELIGDTSIFTCYKTELSLEQRFVKRMFDILFSGIALLIASPFMLLEALMIKVEDRGPVFFTQERVTENGRLFHVYKFRTMIVDAEKHGVPICLKDDPRITRVGRFLRKTRMDELPQMFNIFLGDMSIVGPRPERVEHIETYCEALPEFRYRLQMKAGLTGLAQVLGKYNTSPRDKLMLDLLYIESYSIWNDMKIMFQTLKVIFMPESTEGFDDNASSIFIKDDSPVLNLPEKK